MLQNQQNREVTCDADLEIGSSLHAEESIYQVDIARPLECSSGMEGEIHGQQDHKQGNRLSVGCCDDGVTDSPHEVGGHPGKGRCCLIRLSRTRLADGTHNHTPH